MSLIIDTLRTLGAGEQIVIAAGLLFVGWYLFKGLKLGKAIGSLLGTVTGYTIVAVAAVAVIIGLGWVDPHPQAAIDGINSAKDTLWNLVGDWLLDQINQQLN